MNEGNSYLDILYNISRELAGSLELHEVLTRVLILAARNLGAERASLILLNQTGKLIDAVVLYHGEVTSTDPSFIKNVTRTGLAGWVKRNRKPALLADTHQDNRWIDLRYDGKVVRDPKSALCVPVMTKQQLTGMLTLVHQQVNYFNDGHLQLLQAIADIAGIAIHNALLFHDLQQNRNLYKGLFEGVADPIVVTSFDGSVVEVNRQACATTGYNRRELSKMNIASLDERARKVIANIGDRKKDHQFKHYESRLRTKGKKEIAVEVRVSRIKACDHDHLLWVFNDISERQQFESLRESMTAMIYHDLRSPLANVISSLELIAEIIPAEPTGQVNQLLQIAGHSSAHMQRLISSLLDINRFESGQAIVHKENVDLCQLVDEAIVIVAPLISSKEIVLDKLIPVDTLPINIDADMIKRVLINLLENAIKFSPMRRPITIGVKPGHDAVLVFVEDEGPGIPEEARERIFEKYVRLEADGKARGLGLGLAFCRLAVQAHSGTIWVEKNDPAGSRFCFSLPLMKKITD